MMTGHPGIFAGGDMVPAERTVTVAVGHGKKAARNIDAWLRGAAHEPAPKHALAEFGRLNTWYYSDAPRTIQPAAGARAAPVDLRGGRRRPGRVERPLRSAALPLVRELLLVRQLLRRVPRQRGAQDGRPGRALRDRPRLLQGLRHLRRRVPVGRDRPRSRGDLRSRLREGRRRTGSAYGCGARRVRRDFVLPCTHGPWTKPPTGSARCGGRSARISASRPPRWRSRSRRRSSCRRSRCHSSSAACSSEDSACGLFGVAGIWSTGSRESATRTRSPRSGRALRARRRWKGGAAVRRRSGAGCGSRASCLWPRSSGRSPPSSRTASSSSSRPPPSRARGS